MADEKPPSAFTRRTAKVLFFFFGIILFNYYSRFGATQPAIQYHFFLVLAVLTGLGLLLLPLRKLGEWRSFPFLALGMMLLLQISWRSPVTGRGFIYIWLGWSALFLTLSLLESGVPGRYFLVLIILLGVFEASYGLLQSLGGFDFIGDHYRGSGRLATGTLINRNHFAAALNLSIPMALGALYAIFLQKRQSDNYSLTELTAQIWILLLGLSVLGLAIVLSLSRAGALTLLVTQSLMGVLLFISWDKKGGPGGKIFPMVTVALLLMVIIAGVGVGLNPLLARFEAAASGWDTRTTLYGDTLRMIQDHPLVGVGPGMYRWKIPPYLTGGDGNYHHAHNDLLENAAEWGLPAALAFWAFVVWRFFCSIRHFLKTQDPWTKGLSLGCLGSIFSILLHSLLDSNLQVPANWVLYCTILGLSFAKTRTRDEERSTVDWTTQ
jgi:O-antigen ligase